MNRIALGLLVLLQMGSQASAGETLFSKSLFKDHGNKNWCSAGEGCADTGCCETSDSSCDVSGNGCTDDSCGLGCGLLDGHKCPLGNPFKSSEKCFNDFISPMTNPAYNEDPRTLSEIRPIYINHKIPQGVAGGNINVFAVQLRAALTDRLSIIATKDGFITSSNPLIDDGWADVAAGLKYNLIRDVCNGRLLSAGLIYELPAGSTRSLQGNGDGEFILFLSGGMRLGSERAHLLATTGLRTPADKAAESSSFYLSTHFDYRVTKRGYFLTELNWYNWYQGGNVGVPGAPTVEGADFFNFGAPDVAGNHLVTWAFGTKFKPAENQEFGVAYEIPLSSRNDIFDARLTVDYIYRF